MSSKMTKFENLLEAVPDALVGMDQEGVIRFVNRQTESLFGYDRDDLIGQPVEMLLPEPLWQIYVEHKESYSAWEILGKSVDLLIHTDRLAEAGAVVARLKTGQSMEHLDTTRVRRDGTVFPVSLTVSPIRAEDGEIIGASVICRDMTDMAVSYTHLR